MDGISDLSSVKGTNRLMFEEQSQFMMCESEDQTRKKLAKPRAQVEIQK